jgi:hypothetical protein
MNKQLDQFARKTLKEGLPQCTVDQQTKFKLMYARKGGKRSVEDAKAMPLNEVVDEIPSEKLDWAMEQLESTLRFNPKTS